MADFLARLVARSAGTAHVARPVVPPLFARGPALAADPSPSDERPVEASDARHRWPDAESEPAARAELPSADEAPQARPTETRPVARESRHPSIEREHATARRNRLVASDGEAPAQMARITLRLSGATSGDSAARQPRATAMPAPLALPRDAVRSRRDMTAAAAPAEAPAPIVQISIGRVDVRAVTPADSRAAKPAPARVETRLSLEEYLRAGKRER